MSEFSSIDPATQREIATWAASSEPEIEAALVRAERLARRWADRGVAGRAAALSALGDVLRREEEALARCATEEMGKRASEALAEVRKCAALCDHAARSAVAVLATERVDTDAREAGWRHDPLGPLLAIMPWNFPYWQVIRCAVPAIAVGNPVLLKHAANVQGCAERLVECFEEVAELQGAVQNLRVDHEGVGRLIDDPRVACVSLTGSVRAGRAVAAAAGRALKPVVLELGGSDPFVVLDDADVPRAVRTALDSRLGNSGQSCIAAKRFVVTSGVADAFVDALAAAWSALRVGDPNDPATRVGPLARPDLADTLRDQTRRSLDAGAVELARALAPDGPAFVDAVLLDHVRPGMAAFDEETFGPLGAIVRAADVEDAMALANRTSFGLGATLFTRSEDTARRLLPRFRAGHVAVNDLVRSDPRLPFGGVGDSGVGRELGPHGLRAFANVRAFTFDGFDGPV